MQSKTDCVFCTPHYTHRVHEWEQKVHLSALYFLAASCAHFDISCCCGAFLRARKVPFRTLILIHIMNSVTCSSALWNFTRCAHVVRIYMRAARRSLGNKLTLYINMRADANECMCATQISPDATSTISSISDPFAHQKVALDLSFRERISVMEAYVLCSLGAYNKVACPGSVRWKVLNGWNARQSTTCWICTTRFFISLCKLHYCIMREAKLWVERERVRTKNAGSVSDIFTNLALLFVWEQVLKITQNHDISFSIHLKLLMLQETILPLCNYRNSEKKYLKFYEF